MFPKESAFANQYQGPPSRREEKGERRKERIEQEREQERIAKVEQEYRFIETRRLEEWHERLNRVVEICRDDDLHAPRIGHDESGRLIDEVEKHYRRCAC